LTEIGYAGNLQILLEYTKNAENARQDSMKICVDKGANTKAIMDMLVERSPEINESVSDKTGIVAVEAADKEIFIMSSAGGKVRNVVDVRL
jgi:hypothetical protein